MSKAVETLLPISEGLIPEWENKQEPMYSILLKELHDLAQKTAGPNVTLKHGTPELRQYAPITHLYLWSDVE